MPSSGSTRLLLLALLGAVAWAVLSVSGPGDGRSTADSDPTPDPPTTVAPVEVESTTAGSTVPASEACPGSGYLCSAPDQTGDRRIMRYADDTAVLSVRVPPPEMPDPARARRLQRAAIRGIQVWQGHPFPLRIEERAGGGPVDLEVRWVSRVEGTVLGRTRAQFRSGPSGVEYRAVELLLATRRPGDPASGLPAGTVELTAAHEMGHALGLPHSDDPRDLMYPENTSTHPTPRDYRTVQAVYRIPNGARIVGPG